MLYVLRNGDPVHVDPTDIATGEQTVEVVHEDDAGRLHELDAIRSLLEITFETSDICQAELTRDGLYGVLVIPDENDLLLHKFRIAFYLTPDKLVLIDDSNFARDTIQELANLPLPPIDDVAECLSAFVNFTLDDDMAFLSDYEKKMEDLEGKILANPNVTTNADLLRMRREVHTMLAYYEALGDVIDYIDTSPRSVVPGRGRTMLKALSNRVDRLESHVQMLRDYTLNLRELYQSQVDLRTNRTMQILTIVTTIFMPLTVIGGWFGMNMMMPFLNTSWLYVAVCVAAVVIVVAEVIFFKRKKWL